MTSEGLSPGQIAILDQEIAEFNGRLGNLLRQYRHERAEDSRLKLPEVATVLIAAGCFHEDISPEDLAWILAAALMRLAVGDG